MRLYWIFVALFLVSTALFFVGAFTSNGVMIGAGVLLTVVLFLTRRRFLPK